jgi:hypothetical protein
VAKERNMFEKLVERLIAKRLAQIETSLDSRVRDLEDALSATQDELALAHGRNLTLEKQVKVFEEDIKGLQSHCAAKIDYFSEVEVEKIKELARAEAEIAKDAAVDEVQNDLPDFDKFLTEDTFDPGKFNLIDADNFRPQDYDLAERSEIPDVDDIIEQVTEQVKEAVLEKLTEAFRG